MPQRRRFGYGAWRGSWRCALACACASTCLLPALASAQLLAAVPSASAAPSPSQLPSASRGQQLVESRCFACHSLDAHRVGPALRGVLGRVAGKAAGYAYSDALTAATRTWDAQGIQTWLTDPEQLLPGQRMNYRLDLAQDRADVVAYLATVSDPVRP